jgi:hypothetical protein
MGVITVIGLIGVMGRIGVIGLMGFIGVIGVIGVMLELTLLSLHAIGWPCRSWIFPLITGPIHPAPRALQALSPAIKPTHCMFVSHTCEWSSDSQPTRFDLLSKRGFTFVSCSH